MAGLHLESSAAAMAEDVAAVVAVVDAVDLQLQELVRLVCEAQRNELAVEIKATELENSLKALEASHQLKIGTLKEQVGVLEEDYKHRIKEAREESERKSLCIKAMGQDMAEAQGLKLKIKLMEAKGLNPDVDLSGIVEKAKKEFEERAQALMHIVNFSVVIEQEKRPKKFNLVLSSSDEEEEEEGLKTPKRRSAELKASRTRGRKPQAGCVFGGCHN